MEQSLDPTSEIGAVLAGIPYLAGRSIADFAVERLPGLTNRSYRLTSATEQYVLRLAGAGTSAYIDRAAEEHNARLAAGLGLAPELLHFDPADGTMLTRFAHGARPLAAADLADPGLIGRAARTLRRLHRSGQQFTGRAALLDKLDDYLRLAAARGRPAPAALLGLRTAAEPARSVLHAGPLAPCHIDPTPDNFLALAGDGAGEGLLLLDWEYSAMGAPIWDLADLSVEAAFDDDRDAAMLIAYWGDAPPPVRARLALFKAGLLLLGAAWGQAQLADRTFVQERLERAERLFAVIAGLPIGGASS